MDQNENRENSYQQMSDSDLSVRESTARNRRGRRQKSRSGAQAKSTEKILLTILLTVLGLAALFALTVYITYTMKTGDKKYVDYSTGKQIVGEEMDGMSDGEKLKHLEKLIEEKDAEIAELKTEVDRLTIQAKQVTGSLHAPVAASGGGASSESTGGRKESTANSSTSSEQQNGSKAANGADTSKQTGTGTGTGAETSGSAYGTVVDPKTTIIDDEPITGGAKPGEAVVPATSDSGL